MSDSMREQLVAAIVARLNAPPAGIVAPEGLTIHRYQLRPLENDVLPAIVVYWMSSDPSEKHFYAASCQDLLTEYVLAVRFEIRAVGDPVDAAIDPYVQFVRQCIFSDPSIGGLALGARESSLHVDGEDRAKVYASGTLDVDLAFLEEPYTYVETLIGAPIQRLDFVQPALEPVVGTLTVEDPTP